MDQWINQQWLGIDLTLTTEFCLGPVWWSIQPKYFRRPSCQKNVQSGRSAPSHQEIPKLGWSWVSKKNDVLLLASVMVSQLKSVGTWNMKPVTAWDQSLQDSCWSCAALMWAPSQSCSWTSCPACSAQMPWAVDQSLLAGHKGSIPHWTLQSMKQSKKPQLFGLLLVQKPQQIDSLIDQQKQDTIWLTSGRWQTNEVISVSCDWLVHSVHWHVTWVRISFKIKFQWMKQPVSMSYTSQVTCWAHLAMTGCCWVFLT